MKIGDLIGDTGLRMAALNALRSKGVVSDEALCTTLRNAGVEVR
jgi:hypothetical protein